MRASCQNTSLTQLTTTKKTIKILFWNYRDGGDQDRPPRYLIFYSCRAGVLGESML